MVRIHFLAMLGVLLATAVCKADAQYVLTDLGTFGGSSSYCHSINASGQIAGYASTGHGVHAFVWSPDTPNGATGSKMDLGSTVGSSLAYSINDRGQVAGYYNTSDGHMRGFVTPSVRPIQASDTVGTLGGTDSQALFINASGQVAGTAGTATAAFAYRWSDLNGDGIPQDSEMANLGTPGGNTAQGAGINDLGQTLLYVRGQNPSQNACVWTDANHNGTVDDGEMMSLGNGCAYAINNSETIAGSRYVPGVGTFAYYWNDTNGDGQAEDSEFVDIGSLGGGDTTPWGLGENGWVLGSTNTVIARRAFVYHGGQMFDLTTLLRDNTGWTLSEARDINAAGQICGVGSLNGGPNHAVLLTPVPEPATLAVLSLCGLAVLRRRRAA